MLQEVKYPATKKLDIHPRAMTSNNVTQQFKQHTNCRSPVDSTPIQHQNGIKIAEIIFLSKFKYIKTHQEVGEIKTSAGLGLILLPSWLCFHVKFSLFSQHTMVLYRPTTDLPTLNWPTDLTTYIHRTTYQLVIQSQSGLVADRPAFTKNSSGFHSMTTTLNIVFSVTASICLAQF